MTRTVLASLTTLFLAAASSAQVTVLVQEPASLAGPLDFTLAQWGQQDPLTNTVVTGRACFVDDGTAADSLGCNPLINGADINGKIAVVYRGSCQFGTKSLNAQNAGAIAVIIINNIAGPPVGMGAGDDGPNVTIPVVMITQQAGATLRDAILTCNDLLVAIGSQASLYQYNLALVKERMIYPRTGAIHNVLHTNASEYSVSLGGGLYNYGSQALSNCRLRCVVTRQPGNTVVYDQTSAPAPLPVGDSLFVTLPDFSQSSYSGSYDIAYTAIADEPDELPTNNTINTTLSTVHDRYTYANVNPSTGEQVTSTYVVPSGNTSGWSSCIYFKSPNASRVSATGFWFSASRAVTEVLTDQLVDGGLFQWTGTITSPISLPTGTDLLPITFGSYTFESDLNNTTIYVPFNEVVQLQDNVSYLFCLDSFSGIVWHGWNNNVDYDEVSAITNEPVSMLRDGATWYNGFTGLGGAPSHALRLIANNTIGMEEEVPFSEVFPYPNPTADFLRIPLEGISGKLGVRAYDGNGRLVLERQAQVGGDGQLVLDMAPFANGLYTFRLDLQGGATRQFRVQVNK